MLDIELSFTLDSRYITHIKDKSSYNHNYYKLDLSHYGDYIIYEKCDVLYQECEDDCFEAYYSLGYLDENDKFQAMWTWIDRWDKLENVK